MIRTFAAALATTTCVVALATPAAAQTREYNIPAGSLKAALDAYVRQSGRQVVYRVDEVRSARSSGAHGRLSAEAALTNLLAHSGFTTRVDGNLVAIVKAGNAAVAANQASSSRGETESTAREIVVIGTGSRLRTIDAPLPVARYTAQHIRQSGQPTIPTFLATLPEASVSAPLNATANYGATSTVQLRGMPPGTTLLLLDGYRLGNSAVAASNFDLNQIPSALVERVEIMPFGSSAIYGSDAIAGVVNIDLKTDVDQPNLEVTYGHADGMNTLLASGAFGYSSGPLSAVIGASYMKRDGLLTNDRSATRSLDFSSYADEGGVDARVLACAPGNVRAVSGNLNGVGAPIAMIPDVTNPSIADFVARAGQENRCSPPARLVNALEQGAAIGSLTYDFSGHKVRLSALVSRTENDGFTDTVLLRNIAVPATNIYNPFGQNVIVNTSARAPAGYSSTSTYFRPSITASGELGRWTYNSAFIYSSDRARVRQHSVDQAALSASLISPNPNTAFNPFRPDATPPTVLGTLNPLRENRYLAESYFAHARVNGVILDLPAGPVEVVVGTEYERSSFKRDGETFVGFTGKRRMFSLFGEIAVPLLRNSPIGNLSLSGAARYNHYSDFGSATTPQISLQWKPTDSLFLRAAYSEAFKAPDHSQLLAPGLVFTGFPVTDPKLSGLSYPVTLLLGGNADLGPETGHAFGLSADWRVPAIPGLTLNATYFQTRQDDRIVNAGNFYTALLESEDSFPGRVTRGQDGRIQTLDARFINFGELKIHGIDLGARYRHDFGNGVLTSSAALTYFLKYQGSISPLLPVTSRLSAATASDVWAPRLRGTISLGWTAPGVSIFTSGRYVSSYKDYPGAGGLNRDIGDFAIVDASIEFQPARLWGNRLPLVGDGLYFRLAATNLLNRRPVYSNLGGAATGRGYDSYSEDIVGRTVFATVGMRF